MTRTHATLISIISILTIGFLETQSLIKGCGDGSAFGVAIGAIAGLGGYTLRTITQNGNGNGAHK